MIYCQNGSILGPSSLKGEKSMKTFGYILAGAVAIAVAVGLGWLFMFNGLAMMGYSAPKVEEIRREVVVESQTYRQGNVQYLDTLKMEYVLAPADRKAGLVSTIVRQAALVRDEEMPDDLRVFVACLRSHLADLADGFDCTPGAR